MVHPSFGRFLPFHVSPLGRPRRFRLTAAFNLAILGAGLGLISLASLPARGDIVILNPGFEDISVGTVFNEFTFGAPAGW